MALDSTLEHFDHATQGHNDQTGWRVGRQAIVLGDCLAGMKRLPEAYIDVAITSPPRPPTEFEAMCRHAARNSLSSASSAARASPAILGDKPPDS